MYGTKNNIATMKAYVSLSMTTVLEVANLCQFDYF